MKRPIVWKETGAIALGQVICCGITLAVYWLIGKFSMAAVLGVLVGGILATLNFFIMALGADMAADKGQNQEKKGGQALISLSYTGRMVVLFVLLALLAKTGIFNILALVLPLAYVWPIVSVKTLFLKKGEK